jgi:hypothetical protein
MSNYSITGSITNSTITTIDSFGSSFTYSFVIPSQNNFYGYYNSGSCSTNIFGNINYTYDGSTNTITNTCQGLTTATTSSCPNSCKLSIPTSTTSTSVIQTNLYGYSSPCSSCNSCNLVNSESNQTTNIAQYNFTGQINSTTQSMYFTISTNVIFTPTVPTCSNYTNTSLNTSGMVSGTEYNTTYSFYNSNDSTLQVSIEINYIYNYGQISINGFQINMISTPVNNDILFISIACLSNLIYGVTYNSNSNLNKNNKYIFTSGCTIIGALTPLIQIYSS